MAAHVIRRRPWEINNRPEWRCGCFESGPLSTCDVCGWPFSLVDCGWTGVYGSFQIPKDGLCIDCRKAVQFAREQRAYIAQLYASKAA